MARQVLAIRVDPELREALDDAAGDRGLSRSALAREALMTLVDPEVLRDARGRYRAQAILEQWERDHAAR